MEQNSDLFCQIKDYNLKVLVIRVWFEKKHHLGFRVAPAVSESYKFHKKISTSILYRNTKYYESIYFSNQTSSKIGTYMYTYLYYTITFSKRGSTTLKKPNRHAS